MQLFRHVVNVTVAPGESGTNAIGTIQNRRGFDLSDLDCSFKVKKSLKPEPNTAEVRIYNLAAETRKILETSKKLVLRLEAGYVDNVSQLFLGEIRSAHSTREGPDTITEISTGDSEKELAGSQIKLTIGPKLPADAVLLMIARELGLGLGNVAQAAARLQARGITPFGKGTVIAGNAARAMTDFCRSADLEWSVQDGVIQIVDRGKALEDKAVLLSSSTGLIGSPSVDNQGTLKFKALIQPDLVPGRKVLFESLSFNGGYRIQKCEYSGDTAGNEWFCDGEAVKY